VQLAVEQTELRDKYKHKSVAEQHSLDISWEILMRDQVSLALCHSGRYAASFPQYDFAFLQLLV
jgi:hypothetical protein